MHFPRRARGLALAATTVSIGLLCEHAVHGQEAAQQEAPQRPQQSGQVALPPVEVNTGRRVRPPQRKKQVAKRAPPIEPPPPKVESATGPVQGYLASRSATGIKTDTPLNEIPQSISVVTADRVTDQGAATIQQTLRYVPGVFADAYGPDSRGDFPRVRGSDPDIYLDGMRLVDSFKFNEARIDPYLLSRIEVLRGPSSVLYGNTTTAGIINLVSKRPQEEANREIGVQYGSFNRKQIQTDMTGKLTADGEWLYRFVAIGRDSDYQTDFVKDNRIAIAPALTWRPSKNTTWTVLGLYQNDLTGSSTAFLPMEGTLFPGPNGRIPVNRFVSDPSIDKYQTKTRSVSSLFEHTFSDAFKIRQSTRYTHTDGVYRTAYAEQYQVEQPDPYPFRDPERRTVGRIVNGIDSTRDTVTTDTNAELKFGTGPVLHKILVGVDHRRFRERSASAFYTSGTPFPGDTGTPFDLYAPVYNGLAQPTLSANPDLLQQQTGVYAQNQMRLGPWIAVAGVRHDRIDSDSEGSPLQVDQATSSRFGLMYELPFGLTPYVSYARSFNPIFGANTCVALYCKPVEGEQYEVGFKYQPVRDTVINGAVYDTTEKNRLAPNPAGGDLSIQTGKVHIRGAELEVISSVTRDLNVIATLAYTDARVLEGFNAGKRVETVPLYQASLWAKQKFSLWGMRGFSAGAGVRYIGDSWDGADHFKTPSYTLFDAMLSYENEKWRFQINGTNLADKIHVTTCLARGSPGDCFYGSRRTILSSATYKF